MAEIEVERISRDDPGRFRVRVREGGAMTTHEVSVSDDDRERLTGGAATAEDLVRESFQFLLEREPKESILREFHITVISRYFPEYEGEIRKRLRAP